MTIKTESDKLSQKDLKLSEKTAKPKRAKKEEVAPTKVMLVQLAETTPEKPKRKRTPLTDQQKSVLVERLAKAREAKRVKRESADKK